MLRTLLSWTLALGVGMPPESEVVSAPAHGAVGETTWQSLVGEQVVIAAYGEGPVYAGRLRTVGEQSVVLVYDDGRVVEIAKSSVQEVRLAASEPAAEEAVAPPPPPNDAPAPKDGAAPEDRGGSKTRVPGNGKLFFGGIVCVAGGLGITIGGGLMLRDAKKKEADLEVPGVQDAGQIRRRARAERIAGTTFLVAGPVLMVVGAIVITVAAVRRKKARQSKLSLRGGWLPGGGMVELAGRF